MCNDSLILLSHLCVHPTTPPDYSMVMVLILFLLVYQPFLISVVTGAACVFPTTDFVSSPVTSVWLLLLPNISISGS